MQQGTGNGRSDSVNILPTAKEDLSGRGVMEPWRRELMPAHTSLNWQEERKGFEYLYLLACGDPKLIHLKYASLPPGVVVIPELGGAYAYHDKMIELDSTAGRVQQGTFFSINRTAEILREKRGVCHPPKIIVAGDDKCLYADVYGLRGEDEKIQHVREVVANLQRHLPNAIFVPAYCRHTEQGAVFCSI